MGWEAAPAIGLTVAQLLGGIFAPEGKELSSFEGHDELDPTKFGADLRRGLADYLTLALDEARKPVEVGTTVAPLPSFSGGGLPLHIAAPAQDPARYTPARRTLAPAPTIPDDFAGELRDTSNSRRPPTGHDHPPPEDDPPDGFNRRSSPDGLGLDGEVPVIDARRGTFDAADVDQATGAIALLMQQLRAGVG